MQQIKNILIANDSLDGMQIALEKAAKIEHYSGANLHVAEVIYDAIADESEENLPAEERVRLIEALKAAERRGLHNLTQPFRSRVASIDTHVVWDRDAVQALVKVQSETQAELLVKPVSKHGGIADYVHTPLDWALMRQAPCAVLISKQPDWEQAERVLAAVDVADQKHTELTREVFRTASALAELLDAELHVACAYPQLGQSVNDLQVATDFEGIKQDMRESRMKQINEWIDELGLDVQACHIVEGKPANVISTLANSLPASVSVLGTSARKGLGKLFLGNTAEDIIGRIQGDIVTVR
jgi:universal stress protein E